MNLGSLLRFILGFLGVFFIISMDFYGKLGKSVLRFLQKILCLFVGSRDTAPFALFHGKWKGIDPNYFVSRIR